MLDVDSLAVLDDGGLLHVLDLLLNPLDGADNCLAVWLSGCVPPHLSLLKNSLPSAPRP